jgi:hypothetical protein
LGFSIFLSALLSLSSCFIFLFWRSVIDRAL